MHLQNIMQNFLLLLINCIFKINLMTERCGRRWGVSDRRGCSFSHELNSDRNDEILREHGLESLSRTELCTLLLQSDNTLLPPVSLTTYNMHLQESFKQLTVWICGKKKTVCGLFFWTWWFRYWYEAHQNLKAKFFYELDNMHINGFTVRHLEDNSSQNQKSRIKIKQYLM